VFHWSRCSLSVSSPIPGGMKQRTRIKDVPKSIPQGFANVANFV
jgi:hypothetical protein